MKPATTPAPSVAASAVPAPAKLRSWLRALLLAAAALLALWLWTRICRFPSIPWNDMRLAPTIALAQGWPVYPTAEAGTINTWMYGPLPVLYLWPASWADSAAGALQIAAWLNAALTLVPLALVCALWPVASAGPDARPGRAAALLLAFALWPELHYSVLFSDNLALAAALVANLLLVRSRSAAALWTAAALGTATVACKQIALGIPLAQVVWLGLVAGRSAAWRHAGRCLVTGAAIGGGAVALFGWNGLWFTLVQIPGSFGWAPDLGQRLAQVAPALALHLGVPMVAMLAWRRRFADPALLLPAVTWLCTLPLGLAGLLKLGGWTNSIHSFVLWLPPVLTTLLATAPATRRRALLPLAAALGAALLAGGRLGQEPHLALRPQVADYRLAALLAQQHRGAVWFPVHPLVTLYSDRRYYHDEDGLYVRLKAGKTPSPAHAASELPAGMRLMAFRRDWSDWGIARRMLPAEAGELNVGNWTLRGAIATPPPR